MAIWSDWGFVSPCSSCSARTRRALLVGEADPGAVGMVALFAAGLAWAHGMNVPAVDFTGLDEDGALTLVMSLGREAGLLPPSVELAELRRLFDRFRANHYALYTYK